MFKINSNKEEKLAITIKGNVNVFCPHCNKILWEELPYELECTECGGRFILKERVLDESYE